jgi:glycosyltransferase involved in cell wall biosynthesis
MLVSILIPCFNAEQFIAQAIESALAQTWAEKEIIVVDDGSADRSLEVIKRFNGRIAWEAGPNRGGNAARNRLLEIARGEWLQYLDADDYVLPHKVERQCAFASERPDCDIICSPTIEEKIVNGCPNRIEQSFPPSHDPWSMLALWQLPQTGGSLWRRSAVVKVGGWRVEQPCCQEHELYFRLLEARCHFEFLDSCLAVYRNWEHTSRVSWKGVFEVERQRLIILDRVENCLWERGELTPARRRAVNNARHHIARKYMQQDEAAALDIVRSIERSDPSFCPSEGPVSPPSYRLAYRLLGFRGAQLVARYKRSIRLRGLVTAQTPETAIDDGC